MLKTIFSITFILCLLSALAPLTVVPAHAQSGKQPIEVSAKNTLEWDRDKKTYTAKGTATAKQGNTELHANTLIAHYTDNSNAINRIHAHENVRLISDTSTLHGQKGWYDLNSGQAEMTGNNLKLASPNQTITARDKITYDTKRNEMHAIGSARAVRPTETIEAHTLIARFVKDPVTGQNKLNELEAIGDVTITTPTDILTGERAIYSAATNTATVTGNVRITRESNVITGARGEIDLNTNISRIFADPSQNTRVRGVFYPE